MNHPTFHQSILNKLTSNISNVDYCIVIREGDTTKKFSLREDPFTMRNSFTKPDHIVITYKADDNCDNHYIIVTTYEKGNQPNCSLIDIKKKQVIHTTLHRDNLITFLSHNTQVTLN